MKGRRTRISKQVICDSMKVKMSMTAGGDKGERRWRRATESSRKEHDDSNGSSRGGGRAKKKMK